MNDGNTGSAAGLESADAGSTADVEKSLFELYQDARHELAIAYQEYGTPRGVEAIEEARRVLAEIALRIQA